MRGRRGGEGYRLLKVDAVGGVVERPAVLYALHVLPFGPETVAASWEGYVSGMGSRGAWRRSVHEEGRMRVVCMLTGDEHARDEKGDIGLGGHR